MVICGGMLALHWISASALVTLPLFAVSGLLRDAATAVIFMWRMGWGWMKRDIDLLMLLLHLCLLLQISALVCLLSRSSSFFSCIACPDSISD